MKRAYKTTYRTTYKTAHLGSKVNAITEITAWHDKMLAGLPTTFLILGDSTGNDTYDWPEQTLQGIKGDYPNYTIYSRLWNNTKQCFDPYRTQGQNTRIQTGSQGDAYALCTAGVGNYISVDHSAKQAITGDIDIRVKVALDDWTPAATTTLISKSGDNDGTRGWILQLNASGRLIFIWMPDGIYANRITEVSTESVNFVDGEEKWIRVTLDVDNEAGSYEVKFYKQYGTSEQEYWTQIGDTKVGESTTQINGNVPYMVQIGATTGNGTLNGKIYEAEILNGIDGICVCSVNLDQAFPSTKKTFTNVEGDIVTIRDTVTNGLGSPGLLVLNASTPGRKIEYSTDPIRFQLQTPISPDLAFINYSHNETTNIEYTDDYKGLIDMILAKYADAGIVCSTQNPQKDAAPYSAQHAIRCEQIKSLAIANNYMLVNPFNDFLNYENWEDNLMAEGDNVHPNAAGYLRWANLVIKLLKRY